MIKELWHSNAVESPLTAASVLGQEVSEHNQACNPLYLHFSF